MSCPMPWTRRSSSAWTSIKPHPKYKKMMRRSIRLHAHDERNEAKSGDLVRLVETRPLSKNKRWRVAEIVEVAR